MGTVITVLLCTDGSIIQKRLLSLESSLHHDIWALDRVGNPQHLLDWMGAPIKANVCWSDFVKTQPSSKGGYEWKEGRRRRKKKDTGRREEMSLIERLSTAPGMTQFSHSYGKPCPYQAGSKPSICTTSNVISGERNLNIRNKRLMHLKSPLRHLLWLSFSGSFPDFSPYTELLEGRTDAYYSLFR